MKLSFQQFGVFQTGAGGFGGRRSSPNEMKAVPVPERPPDAVIEDAIDENQVLLN